ncbi:hypothetical protein N7462_007007 [Penicillium macrosclerotiorum]|uniref:uncharacterized protein n=1 Tax=Penicillium macrosclerotiorum TaxID=303699 RepID=UPI0025492E07|nr:uncharacterized protein N7462_007007 [Penicillium macrosclerotiorum]KAJ5678763.1 hypothetical protein N7462_007007 [Penicillium macrosclerotiorum]
MNPIPSASFIPCLLIFSLLASHIPPVSGLSTVHISRSNEPLPLNRPLLGIQIGSIAGAYIVFVASLIALLLFVGRKLRRTVQSSNCTLQMEMLKPELKSPASIDPSPISPGSPHYLASPTKAGGYTSWGSLPHGSHPSQPSVNGSMVTVDESVVASDRQRNQNDLEMLYAAVMEHDAQKAAGINVSTKEPDSMSTSPDSHYTNPFADPHRSRSDLASASSLKSPISTKSNGSSRLSKLFNLNSRSSTSESHKLRSPRMPPKKVVISSPMASPDIYASKSYGNDQAPMSPRIYFPRQPPPNPRVEPPAPVKLMNSPGRSRVPPPLNLTPNSIHSHSSSLPLREAYPLQSAPATKTTILERPMKGRGGPMTGMPTPYSPYMPFTPVTPFTPGHRVTRDQRRLQERQNNLRVLNEDDMVKDNDDVWG